MKDLLTDIVSHTHSLGFLSLVKITSEEDSDIKIESMAEDRSVILNATTSANIQEFQGTFGMPNLDKLALHLKNPEYQEDAKIEVITGQRNGATIPVSLHFENKTGDFQNDYRFMNTEIINEKMKSVKFKGAKWDIEFEPTIASISRLKLQATANSDASVFQVKTENNNLVFSFGDANTHAGSFVFEHNIMSSLKHTWSWPIQQIMSILTLSGDKTMRIADIGAMMISVNSGICQYDYILPAQTK